MKDEIVFRYTLEAPYLAKFLLVSYYPKWSRPIRLQDFLNVCQKVERYHLIFCLQKDTHWSFQNIHVLWIMTEDTLR